MHGGTARDREEGLVTASSRWVPAGLSVLSALLVVGPGLAPGYLLVRDMVFVPRPPLNGRLLGLGHESARAVPSDLVVALASHVLPGDLVQKLVLLALLVAAGTGAAALVPRGPVTGAAAALVAIWNPFVGERLAMGQWAVLVGYAALPWVLRGVVDLARGVDRGHLVVVALVAGSLGGGLPWVTVGLGLLAGVAAVAVTSGHARPTLRRCRWVMLFWLALALPWAVPALTRPNGLVSDPQGFSAFAPRPDSVLGVVGSLLTGGGSWNAAVVPAGRATLVGGLAAALLLAWAAAGFALTRGSRASRLDPASAAYRVPVVTAGALTLVLGCLSAVPALLEPLAQLPGGGLLRDGSRQLGAWVLVLAVGCGWGVRWLGEQRLPRALGWLAAVAPVAVLPSLGWGLSGLFQPVAYPADVRLVAQALGSAPEPGAVAVLPFEAYRRYPWNADLSSMTPWSRLVDRRVVASSDLVVTGPSGDVRVAGEDAYAEQVGRALEAPDAGWALGALGVRWLLVDVTGVAAPSGTTVLTRTPDVTLLRVDAVVAAERAEHHDPPVVPVVVGDAVWAAAVLAALWATRRRRRGRGYGEDSPTIR